MSTLSLSRSLSYSENSDNKSALTDEQHNCSQQLSNLPNRACRSEFIKTPMKIAYFRCWISPPSSIRVPFALLLSTEYNVASGRLCSSLPASFFSMNDLQTHPPPAKDQEVEDHSPSPPPFPCRFTLPNYSGTFKHFQQQVSTKTKTKPYDSDVCISPNK